MKITLIPFVVLVSLMILSLPVKAEDQGWSFRPFELKDSYTEDQESVYTLSWGAELDESCGVFKLLGSGNAANGRSKYTLDYSNELGAWFFNLWGIIDSTKSSTLHDNGLKFRWENEYLFAGASFKSLERESESLDYRYGYEGWEGKANWGWLMNNGTQFKMIFNRKLLDYSQMKNDVDKLYLENTLSGKTGHSYWSFVWKEWSDDYPENLMDNLWKNQGEFKWSHRFQHQYMNFKLTGMRCEHGDSIIEDYAKIEWGETYYLNNATLTLKSYLSRENGESWVSEAYSLNQEQEEDWGIDTKSGWGTDISFRKEIGLHRQWKFGGYYHENDDSGSWGVHTEWDFYIFNGWRMRFNLHTSGKDDRENPAGAWLKLTYYF